MRHLSRGILFVLLAAGCSSKPASIEVSPRPVKIYGLNRVQRLTGRLVDKKGRPADVGSVQWASSKTDIVTVDASGKLTSVKEGTSVVTASFEKLSVPVPVEVVDVKTIEITPATAHLVGPAGTALALTPVIKNTAGKSIPRTVTWSSAKPAVATISPEGVVTAIGPGTTMILGKIGDLQGASEVTVTVGEVARVEIHPTTALVRVGDSQRFEIIAYAPDGAPYEACAAAFQSSDPAVATVDANGTASGIATGTATIKASIAGVGAEATILVN